MPWTRCGGGSRHRPRATEFPRLPLQPAETSRSRPQPARSSWLLLVCHAVFVGRLDPSRPHLALGLALMLRAAGEDVCRMAILREGHMGRLVRRSARQDIDLAGDDPAAGDLDLAVADIAVDAAGGMDDQLLRGHELTLEDAADLGGFDLGLALEHADGRDLDCLAVGEHGFDPAL